MNVSVEAKVEADGTLRCEITAGDRKAVVRFTDGGICLSVPEASGP